MSLRQAVRLLLVEPHRPVHAAVERPIERQKLPYVLETAASPQEALSRLRQASCDAVLLDLGELAHLQRLSGMSTRVPELAHELSQPLCAIADYARACRHLAQNLQGDGREEVVDFVGRIADQADRAGQIIRRLRESARRADCPRSAVDLNHLVRELVVLLEVAARPHDVRIELVLDAGLPRVTIDRIQIEQVITNLVRNAVEAVQGMPQPRRVVTIRTSLAEQGEVAVAVEDNGKGLEEEEAERVFEPFYTRKADGLGLGLWISRSIVEAHGGRLKAAPGAGGGTIFRFNLPVEGEGGQR